MSAERDDLIKPDPDEFRRFINLFQDKAPDEYTPWLFRVGKGSKAPAAGGSWKDPDNRLTPEKAVQWMEYRDSRLWVVSRLRG